jgi:hypothetical protein
VRTVNPTFQTEAEAAPRPAPPPLVDADLPPAASRPARSWLLACVLALLVVVAGALLGVAGFAGEQRLAVWDPSVAATATGGWRIAGSSGLRPVDPVIADGRLVWNQGPNIVTLDLVSGETHVVGVAPRWMAAGPPAAAGSRVAWLEVPRIHDRRRAGRVWVYDAARGRRWSLAAGAESTSPATDGELVAWLDGGVVPTVRDVDTATGRQATIARAPGIVEPVLADDGFVGWLRTRADGRGPRVVLRDPAAGTTTTVPLGRQKKDSAVGDVQLRGGVLVWSVRSERETVVMTHDLRSGRSRVVARGDVESPATDGDLVAWVAADERTGCVVRGLRLAGGAVADLARPATRPSSLAVGDGWIAWALSGGPSPSLVLERIAR